MRYCKFTGDDGVRLCCCSVGLAVLCCSVGLAVLSDDLARFVPFHLHAMDWGRGGRFRVPHILNPTYQSACLSRRITITVSGVGDYPLKLKKLKTARPVILYRTATWWGCNPCRSRLMGLFIQPNHLIPPAGHCPVKNIADISAAVHGLLVRFDWERVGIGLGVLEQGGGFGAELLYTNLYIALHTHYSSVSQPLWDRGPVNSFFIRRGPGPNRFTRKYLSNFFKSIH